MKKVVIFDFDGTIADTFGIFVQIANRLSTKFGYNSIKKSDIARLRSKKGQEVLKDLGISFIKLPFVVKKYRSEVNKEIKNAHPIKGIRETLVNLKKRKYTLGILTSNSLANVNIFLKKHKLDMFDFVHSEKNIFGKPHALKQLLKLHCLQPKKCSICWR